MTISSVTCANPKMRTKSTYLTFITIYGINIYKGYDMGKEKPKIYLIIKGGQLHWIFKILVPTPLIMGVL